MSVSVKLMQAASGGGAADAAWVAEIGDGTPDYDIRGAAADEDGNIYVVGRHTYFTSNNSFSLVKLDSAGNFIDAKYVPHLGSTDAFAGRPAYASNSIFYAGTTNQINGRLFNKYGSDFSSSTSLTSAPPDTANAGDYFNSESIMAIATSNRVFFAVEEGNSVAAVWVFDHNLNAQKYYEIRDAAFPTIYNFRSDNLGHVYLTMRETGSDVGGQTFTFKYNSSAREGHIGTKRDYYFHYGVAVDASEFPYFIGEGEGYKFIAKYNNVFAGGAQQPIWAYDYSGVTTNFYDIFYDSVTGYLYAVAYGSSKLKILTVDPSDGSVVRSQEMDSPSGDSPWRGGSTLVDGEYLLIPIDAYPDSYLVKYPLAGIVPGTYDGVTWSDYSETLTDISAVGNMEVLPNSTTYMNAVEYTQTDETKSTETMNNDTAIESAVTPVTSN